MTRLPSKSSTFDPVDPKEWHDGMFEDTGVNRMLESFRLRCSFTYFTNPAHHHLHSLRPLITIKALILFTPGTPPPTSPHPPLLRWEVGHITAEKTSPSAIQFYGDLKEAINIERRLNGAENKSTKDLLSKMCAEYNKMVTVRAHRIDSARRSMAYNMFLSNLFG